MGPAWVKCRVSDGYGQKKVRGKELLFFGFCSVGEARKDCSGVSISTGEQEQSRYLE